MEDIFGPIQQGFRDVMTASELREKRALRRDEFDLKKDELRQKGEETSAKKAELLRKQAAQQELTDYVGSGQSPMVADPQLGALLSKNGQSITPAMKPKIDTETMAKLKYKLADDAISVVQGLGDGDIDPASLTDQQNFMIKMGTGIDLTDQANKNAAAKMKEIKAKIPADKLEFYNNQMLDYQNNVIKPFYKKSGYSDEELDKMFSDPNHVDDYLYAFANKTNDPMGAIMDVEKEHIGKLDQQIKEKVQKFDRYGTMSIEELNKQDTSQMNDLEKGIWNTARVGRYSADLLEKSTGQSHVENIFGDVGAIGLIKLPSEILKSNFKKYDDEKKAKKSKGSKGGKSFRDQGINDLTDFPSNSSADDRVKKVGTFVR